MKYIYLTFESFELDPIIKSQVVPLLKELHDKGYEVGLVTLESNKITTAYPFELIKLPRAGFIKNHVSVLRYLLGIKQKKVAIHVRGYLPMFMALIAKIIRRHKIIFDPRGLFVEELSYKLEKSVKSSVIIHIFKCLEKVFYKYSDHVVVVSNPFERFINSNFASVKEISVIPTFSNRLQSVLKVNFIRELEWEDKVVIVYSGSCEKWQCLDEIIKFFEELSVNPQYRFCFFTKSIAEMEQRISKSIPKEKCFISSFEPEQLNSALELCDYGILFREDELLNKVASPIKIKDYLLSGLPIIYKGDVGDYDLLKKIKGACMQVTTENFATYLKLQKVSPELKQNLQLKSAEDFSLNAISSIYSSIYDKVNCNEN